MKKTIAQQLNITEFPFEIKDKMGNTIYLEDKNGYWERREIDSEGREVYYEDSNSYFSKTVYDEQGNEIYSQNPFGRIYKQPAAELDPKPKPKAAPITIEITQKFRKKPIEIKAVQFNNQNKDMVYNWAKSIQGNVFHGWDENKQPILKIPTLEGEMECSIGDYLIVEPFPTDWRKLYPCKKSIFEQTYELLS